MFEVNEFNIFIACAMAADSGKLKEIQPFIDLLEEKFGPTYYAPRKYSDPATYPEPYPALQEVLDNIKHSKILFLYYPEKVPSGALVELGYALALKKKIVVYTEDLNNLSYILREGYDNMIVLTNEYESWQDSLIHIVKSYL